MLTYHPPGTPDFSVIITSYNDGIYLDEAIQSVLNSTFKNFEIILVDDCSTDPFTTNKLNQCAQQGFRVILKDANKGISDSRNQGIQAAKGKYILPLDADDRILPAYLEKSFALLEQGNTVIYCNVKRFGLEESVIPVPDFSFANLLAGNFIVNCSAFTKDAWVKTGGYDTNMVNYEDWEFWVHVAETGGKFFHIDEVLFEYRAKPSSHNNKCADPDYRAELVKYVCEKHRESYQKHVTAIVPYLHKTISLLEADNIKKAVYEKSIFGKMKRAADRLGLK